MNTKKESMTCLICNSETNYYFSKIYTDPPYNVFMTDIGEINYHKCGNCGFVLSKTHSELDKKRWEKLNYEVHTYLESPNSIRTGNQPPYLEQAAMLAVLGRNGLINLESMLDYAAGYGTLSSILMKYFNISLPLYDPYMKKSDDNRYVEEGQLTKYQTVLNCAMFEHITTREDLEYVNNLVDDNGCLIIHTVICENIPKDPDWFLLRFPVHTAFHTNKSMDILMEQWGYESSVYCPNSKCWILFKKDSNKIEQIVSAINKEFQSTYLHYKKGFVDYWKGF